MDTNLAYAQAFGKLSLSLRHPDDQAGVDPVEIKNLRELLAELNPTDTTEPDPVPAWKTVFDEMTTRIGDLESTLKAPREPADRREALVRIGEGMQAITIQTPYESNGLAGLLEPGDRVDLQLTLQSRASSNPMATAGRLDQGDIPSEKLIENIEVLAVDANIDDMQGEGEKEVPRSVTLIVMEEMIADINRAAQLGTLTLTLRGLADAEATPPRTVMTVAEFVETHMPPVQETTVSSSAVIPPVYIRTLRGPSPQVLPFTVKEYVDPAFTSTGRN